MFPLRGFCFQGPESYISTVWHLRLMTGIICFLCMALVPAKRKHMIPVLLQALDPSKIPNEDKKFLDKNPILCYFVKNI